MRRDHCLLLSLVAMGAFGGCDSEVRRNEEVSRIVREAKQQLESLDALRRLEPYLNDESAFVRRWACQAIGDIYGGTQNDEIASACVSVLCQKLDDYEGTTVAKNAARALLKVGVPSGHPDAALIERKLCSLAKNPNAWDTPYYAMDALAVIENPSEETFNALVHCLQSVPAVRRHHAASALARFGSRAAVVLPDLKQALAKTPSSEVAHDEIAAAIKTIEEAVEQEEAAVRR
jgi:HEAT repeat protein